MIVAPCPAQWLASERLAPASRLLADWRMTLRAVTATLLLSSAVSLAGSVQAALARGR
jgi:hypothetical protein